MHSVSARPEEDRRLHWGAGTARRRDISRANSCCGASTALVWAVFSLRGATLVVAGGVVLILLFWAALLMRPASEELKIVQDAARVVGLENAREYCDGKVSMARNVVGRSASVPDRPTVLEAGEMTGKMLSAAAAKRNFVRDGRLVSRNIFAENSVELLRGFECPAQLRAPPRVVGADEAVTELWEAKQPVWTPCESFLPVYRDEEFLESHHVREFEEGRIQEYPLIFRDYCAGRPALTAASFVFAGRSRESVGGAWACVDAIGNQDVRINDTDREHSPLYNHACRGDSHDWAGVRVVNEPVLQLSLRGHFYHTMHEELLHLMILIGATTDNPSFALRPALLSRVRVFQLHKLSEDDILLLLLKAIRSPSGLNCPDFTYPQTNADKCSEQPDAPAHLPESGVVIVDSQTELAPDGGGAEVGAAQQQAMPQKAGSEGENGEANDAKALARADSLAWHEAGDGYRTAGSVSVKPRRKRARLEDVVGEGRDCASGSGSDAHVCAQLNGDPAQVPASDSRPQKSGMFRTFLEHPSIKKRFGGRRAKLFLCKLCVEDGVLRFLARASDGDARLALNALELAVLAAEKTAGGGIVLSSETVCECLRKPHLLYDRAGDQHYDCISALIKSMRGSDADAALYWCARILEAGEDPLYVTRRLIRFASEDIGLVDPNALPQAIACHEAVKSIGSPECFLNVAQGVVLMALSHKSHLLRDAYGDAAGLVKSRPLDPVPLHLRNAPTQLMSEWGHGRGYVNAARPVEGQTYLPEGLQGRRFLRMEDSSLDSSIGGGLGASGGSGVGVGLTAVEASVAAKRDRAGLRWEGAGPT